MKVKGKKEKRKRKGMDKEGNHEGQEGTRKRKDQKRKKKNGKGKKQEGRATGIKEQRLENSVGINYSLH